MMQETFNIIDMLKYDTGDVYCWGAGLAGENFLNRFKYSNKIKGILDNSSEKWGKCLCGFDIISPEFFSKKINRQNKKVGIIIAIDCLDSVLGIEKQLKLLGINCVSWNFYIEKEIREIKPYANFEKIYDTSKIESMKEILDDDVSKEIIEEIMHIRKQKYDFTEKMKQRFHYLRMKGNIQYLDKDILTFTQDEIVLDAGAYNGDTMGEYYAVNNGWKKYYCIEADAITYKKLLVKTSLFEHVDVFNVGLGKSVGKASFFSEDTMGSHLDFSGNNRGNSEIEIRTVDSFNEAFTFIKMDIEGAEYDAILGAQKTLEKYKPKLAICIYHKNTDLWKIPLLIKKIVPEYKFKVRHYSSFNNCGTVLYAYI
ncbi:FkbM family methyltransferase [Pectinatus haikarae]|uniref:FkbM family methyltransferase n=1 Tax=Pectinatus haikarae TaxID=349096 RepID=UPI0018C623D2|nr:FkbM family methyltransferase [Pectinatus haikarae]